MYVYEYSVGILHVQARAEVRLSQGLEDDPWNTASITSVEDLRQVLPHSNLYALRQQYAYKGVQ